MTDHKPLSEGEIVSRLQTMLREHPVHVGLCVEWRDETVRRAIELIELATPKPLDGEAVMHLLKTAQLLLQNAEGCAMDHYGIDFQEQGLPGWLSDARADIERAAEFLSLPAQTCEATEREAISVITLLPEESCHCPQCIVNRLKGAGLRIVKGSA